MALIVYNTLSRSDEEFRPMNGKHVNMFVCGLTVYDDAHIGHAKTFISFDIIVKWLRHIGYDVKYIQNITDVDDKIINRAKEAGMEASELAGLYEKRFLEDMDALGVRKDVDDYPRSHDYIDAIREQIQLLIDKGYAYVLEGDVYYDVAKFKDYTKLSGIKIEELENHRIEPNPDKKNVYDFALWKAAKPGEPSWRIKINAKGSEIELVGRPGWHIEDTAITYVNFGPQYDIHGGASELIFPHHTNEIAQAEGAFGVKPFVKYWVHTGVVNVNGTKMSKSLKNFVTIRDVLKQYDAETMRTLCASTHYSKEMNYSESLMKDARKKINYMYAAFSIFYNMRESKANAEDDVSIKAKIDSFVKDFEDAMNDNFNTSLALSKLVILINDLRSFAETHESINSDVKKHAISSIKEMAGIFGLLKKETYKQSIPLEADMLVKRREELRKSGNFTEADRIRDELKSKYKVSIEDTEYGSVWYPIE
jgi:cysteinyl-tRNA synthetase